MWGIKTPNKTSSQNPFKHTISASLLGRVQRNPVNAFVNFDNSVCEVPLDAHALLIIAPLFGAKLVIFMSRLSCHLKPLVNQIPQTFVMHRQTTCHEQAGAGQKRGAMLPSSPWFEIKITRKSSSPLLLTAAKVSWSQVCTQRQLCGATVGRCRTNQNL